MAAKAKKEGDGGSGGGRGRLDEEREEGSKGEEGEEEPPSLSGECMVDESASGDEWGGSATQVHTHYTL